LFPKCVKTHLRASANPKYFPGVIHWNTVEKGGEGFWERRERGIGGEGMKKWRG
jgi:hypothetical protein